MKELLETVSDSWTTYVKNLLFSLSKKENKIFYWHSSKDSSLFPIVLPNGLGELRTDSPTFVCILWKLDNYRNIHQQIGALVKEAMEKKKKYSFVILSSDDDDQIEKARKDYFSLAPKKSTCRVLFKGKSFILSEATSAKAATYLYIQANERMIDFQLQNDGKEYTFCSAASANPFIQNLSQKIHSIKSKDLKELSDTNLTALQYRILDRSKDSENFILVLGNGISLSYGSDSWSSLINNMVDYMQPMYIDDKDRLSEAIGSSAYSKSLLTDFVFSREGQQSNYYKALHYCVYRKYIDTFPENTTLSAVSRFLYAFKPEVITFNYDELFERDFRHKFPQIKIESVWNEKSDREITGPNIIKIKHVHGFMPLDFSKFDEDKRKSVVLNEEEYFRTYNWSNPSWALKTLEAAINEGCCLFIGTSLSDIFIRRLIINSKHRHFTFMAKNNLSDKDQFIVTAFFSRMHLDVIWVENYLEMVSSISKLSKLKK
jgi:hypothetical protein